MAQTDAELEIGLRYRPSSRDTNQGEFDVTLNYDDPSDNGDRREFGDSPLVFDTARLNTLIGNEKEYGDQLARDLLQQDAKVGAFYGETCATAERQGYSLHLRLLIDPRAPAQYHAIRWEMLRDREDAEAVAIRQNVLFSRYLSSTDWRAVSPPARADLRALVAVADPSDIEAHKSFLSGASLPPINVDDEMARASAALGDIDVVSIDGPVTMHSITDTLARCAREGRAVDILYLICHGRFVANEDGTQSGDSVLFLQRADGRADRVDGRTLALRIGDLPRRPTIAVLCSCQSAGDGTQDSLDAGAQSAIGPELAKRGVPAVIAMQGNIHVTTAQRFLTAFFTELQVDGIVDRAVAAARTVISKDSGWWMPVLFSRLRSGATYYVPEFGDKAKDIWEIIATSVDQGKCTPVVGSGLSDSILGSREAMAERWVGRWQVPIARHARSDLAMVSQYLRVRTSAAHPANELCQYLLSEMRQKYRSVLPDDVLASRSIDTVISAVGAHKRKQRAADPFAIVASIESPVYFTTSWTTLLEDALSEAKRPATSRFFDWSDIRDDDNDEDFGKPTVDNPLVFHLFGKFTHPESLVLSEEDYFKWLRTWIERREFYVGKKFGTLLTRRSLMFLGYRLDDWDFRVLFQGIKSFGASTQLEGNKHVAVQISRESTMIEPEALQDYLESYFQADEVHIYWGDAITFLEKLADLRARRREAELA